MTAPFAVDLVDMLAGSPASIAHVRTSACRASRARCHDTRQPRHPLTAFDRRPTSGRPMTRNSAPVEGSKLRNAALEGGQAHGFAVVVSRLASRVPRAHGRRGI